MCLLVKLMDIDTIISKKMVIFEINYLTYEKGT